MSALDARFRKDSAFLHAHGIDVGPATFTKLVREVVQSFPKGLRGDPAQELTAEEAALLERGGGDLTARDLGENDPVARAAADLVALVQGSLTTAQAALELGVDPSRIRQRLSDKTIYGFRWEGRWLLPPFQFDQRKVIRGLDQIFPVLEPNLSPIEVHSWLTTPDPEFHADRLGQDLTPLEWLKLGYSPEPLIHIARNL